MGVAVPGEAARAGEFISSIDLVNTSRRTSALAGASNSIHRVELLRHSTMGIQALRARSQGRDCHQILLRTRSLGTTYYEPKTTGRLGM